MASCFIEMMYSGCPFNHSLQYIDHCLINSFMSSNLPSNYIIIVFNNMTQMRNQKDISRLLQLQQSLKREYLLVEKEQQEKNKIKSQIEAYLKQFYSSKTSVGDSFDNCYNFVKDVVTYTSRNISFGLQLIRLGPISIIPIIVNILYERIERSQGKDITTLACRLIAILFQNSSHSQSQQQLSEITVSKGSTFQKKIMYFLQTYLLKEEIQIFFERICRKFVKEKCIFKVLQRHLYNCPEIFKTILTTIYKEANNVISAWSFLITNCLLPLKKINSLLINQSQKQLQALRSKFYLKDQITMILKPQKMDQTSSSKITLIMRQLGQLQSTPNELQISVFGGCLSCSEIRLLITTIIQNKADLYEISEKVVNRALKVQQISKDLSIFDHNHHVLLTEFVYSELIQKDYHRLYSNHYSLSPLKHILRQILIETPSLDSNTILNIKSIEMKQLNKEYSLRETLTEILSKMEDELLSIPLEMKIKYALRLLKGLNHCILDEMKEEYESREEESMHLYRETKLSLLKAYCNIKKGHASSEPANMIKAIASTKINLCIAPADYTMKYRITNSQQITVSPIRDCLHHAHQQYHSYFIYQALQTFVHLKEVKALFLNYDPLQMHQAKKAYQEIMTIITKDVQKNIQFHQKLQPNCSKNISVEDNLFKIVLRALEQLLLRKKIHSKLFSDQQDRVQRKKDRVLYQNSIQLQKHLQLSRILPMEIEEYYLPQQKMKKIKQIYKVSQQKGLYIFKSIVKAKPFNLFSQLTFIQLFIKEEKLLSLQGIILKQIYDIASQIHDNNIDIFVPNFVLLNSRKRPKSI